MGLGPIADQENNIPVHVTAIIAAAGVGRRLGAPVPKQLITIGGVSMLQRTLDAFSACPRVTDLVVVTVREVAEEPSRFIKANEPGGKKIVVVEGGNTRQESVAIGFDHVPPRAEYVVVHDAARPFVTPALIERTLDAALESGAAIAALPAKDTVKECTHIGGHPRIARTLEREGIYLAQTPQVFRRDVLQRALALARQGAVATDEAGLVELTGHPIRLVEGDPRNLKVTTDEDLVLARELAGGKAPVAHRIGAGYDLHRLVEGRPLVLAGVRIPTDRGPLGHSDGDVVCHALVDAVLGAAGAGDIGRYFPDSDPRWKDAPGLDLLARAMEMVRAGGFAVENVDVVVVLERPKIRPHVEAIRGALAGVLAVDPSRVSVKGKTNEGVDAVGRGEAIAAHAVVLLGSRPAD